MKTKRVRIALVMDSGGNWLVDGQYELPSHGGICGRCVLQDPLHPEMKHWLYVEGSTVYIEADIPIPEPRPKWQTVEGKVSP